MAWKLIYVKGGKTLLPDGTREFNQIVLERELQALGATAWCGRDMVFKRHHKSHTWEPTVFTALPNYLVTDLTPEQHQEAVKLDLFPDSISWISKADMEGHEAHKVETAMGEYRQVPKKVGILEFMKMVDEKYEEAKLIDTTSREAVSTYKKGQKILALSGPFVDAEITFKRIVQDSHEVFPMIEGEIELMGRKVSVPLEVINAIPAEVNA